MYVENRRHWVDGRGSKLTEAMPAWAGETPWTTEQVRGGRGTHTRTEGRQKGHADRTEGRGSKLTTEGRMWGQGHAEGEQRAGRRGQGHADRTEGRGNMLITEGSLRWACANLLL